MREIRFRVWAKKPNKMYTFITLQWLETLYVGGIGAYSQVMYAIDDTIVLQQYTGLCDKNGRQIFEGDIIQAHDEFEKNEGTIEPVEVVWEHDGWVIHARANDLYLRVRDWTEYSVIGNVYENPELLTN
jgi:uncharacterized phage protein (TIGR01671 family)